MRRAFAPPIVFALGLLVGVASGAPLLQAQPRTIWDKVYTSQQAERGREAYSKRCIFCHGGDLGGGEANRDVAPALAGPTFPIQFRGPLSELFLKISEGMPKDDPGSLSEDTVTDILSFILEANQAAPGEVALPADLDILKEIAITRRP